MLSKDKRAEAERFIETVIAPRRAARVSDRSVSRARAELAEQNLKLAKAELAQSGIDVDRFDKVAAKGSQKRKKLAQEERRHAVDASADTARRLLDIAPVILPIEP